MTGEPFAGNVVAWAVQVLVIGSLGAALLALFRIHDPRARLAACHILLIACLALPFVQPWRETSTADPVTRSMTQSAAASSEATGFARSQIDWGRVLLWVLAMGAGARFCWLLAGCWRISRYRRSAIPIDPLPSSVETAKRLTGSNALFCASPELTGPVTFGARRPVVLLPAAFGAMNAEAQVAVACHELIHVRRRDWLITIVEETYASLVWFHPAIWWLIAQARLSREQLVDARVVGITDDREPYIHALLQIAGARPSLDLAPASLFLRRRHLAHRMHSLTTEALPMSKRQLFVSCISMLLILAVAGWGAIVSFPLTALAEAPPAEVQDDGFVVRQNATVYYPREAIETGLEGEVVVELTFNTGGTIVDSRVLSGPDALRRAAIQTAIGGTYTVTGNRTLQVIVEFALENIPTGVAGGRGLRGGPAGAPPPPPPPPPAPGDRLRVSAGVSSANLIQQVPPVYPPLARQARIQGLVIVEATIDPAGNVSSARVVSGHPLLAAAAVEAVLQWKYRPTLLNGAPIAVVTTANVTFSLRPE